MLLQGTQKKLVIVESTGIMNSRQFLCKFGLDVWLLIDKLKNVMNKMEYIDFISQIKKKKVTL